MKSICSSKRFLGLVEMMFGLVNVSFSLLEWQAVKMIFFTPFLLRSRKKKQQGRRIPISRKKLREKLPHEMDGDARRKTD